MVDEFSDGEAVIFSGRNVKDSSPDVEVDKTSSAAWGLSFFGVFVSMSVFADPYMHSFIAVMTFDISSNPTTISSSSLLSGLNLPSSWWSYTKKVDT